MPSARRFPPPWTAEETDACFIVRDASGQALAYVYFEEEPGRTSGGEATDPRRGAADRGQHRKAAGGATALEPPHQPLAARAEGPD